VETASTTPTSVGMASKVPAGSSKYITLTIRR
jgi:hypothetical protein